MLIQARGLHHGERLKKCSDRARLWWPYLFLAANSFGRMRLSYAKFLSDVAVDFDNPPSEEEFWGLFSEYRENHLAFLYQYGDEIWCQWWCAPGTLPRYPTKESKDSPGPPSEEYEAWVSSYIKQSKTLATFPHDLPKSFGKISEKFPKSFSGPAETFPHDIGVGVGGGIGVGVGAERCGDLQRACRNDPSFAEFHRICTERGILGASDEDWMWTYHSWKVLDFEQKAKALGDLKTRNAQAVEIASPALPQNYVKSKKWNRPQLNGSSPHRTLSRAEEMLRDA